MPPLGKHPNDRNLTQYPQIIPLATIHILTGLATGISILLTIGRLIIRWRKLHRLHWDDILNAVAAVLVIPFVVLCSIYVPYQYQAQLYYLEISDVAPPLDELKETAKLELPLLILFWLVIYTVKASFLALYYHLFAVSKSFRVGWCLTATFIMISFLTTFLSIFWSCGTPSKILDTDACSTLDSRTGTTMLALWCGLNVIGGLLLMFIPLYMVTSRLLSLQTAQRAGLIFVFGLVLLDIVFDILRTVWSLSPRLTAETNLNAIWTMFEPAIAVTVCALPHYKSLISCRRQNSQASARPSFKAVRVLPSSGLPRELDDVSAYSLYSREPAASAV